MGLQLFARTWPRNKCSVKVFEKCHHELRGVNAFKSHIHFSLFIITHNSIYIFLNSLKMCALKTVET